MQNQNSKRIVFMISGAIDSILGGIALMVYFGWLPVDISSWDMPRWIIGLIGGILFFTGLGMFTFFLFKTDSE